MADEATMTIKAVLLPDEIQKTLKDLSFEYTPANNTEGWYYKLTDVKTSSANLIDTGASFMQFGASTGADAAQLMHTTAGTDKIKFLFIKHTGYEDDGTTANTADSVYLNFDGTAAANDSTTCVEIGPNESWYGKPNCTIANMNCISGVKNKGGTSGVDKIQCIIAAIIDNI